MALILDLRRQVVGQLHGIAGELLARVSGNIRDRPAQGVDRADRTIAVAVVEEALNPIELTGQVGRDLRIDVGARHIVARSASEHDRTGREEGQACGDQTSGRRHRRRV